MVTGFKYTEINKSSDSNCSRYDWNKKLSELIMCVKEYITCTPIVSKPICGGKHHLLKYYIFIYIYIYIKR